MTVQKGSFFISTDRSLLQLDRIHRFLSKESYWSLEIPPAIVQKSIENSLCFGVYEKTGEDVLQVGFARVISDLATFAYLCDVYIEGEYRGRDLSKWLVETIMAQPELQGLRRYCLATLDAHKLYEKFGFQITPTPNSWMEIKDNDIYRKQRLR
jgi:GNAT superfamily N-acetyltransferase